MNRQAEHDIRRKTKVLEHAKQSGNVSHTCRWYGISRDTFYRWKHQYETGGPEALVNSKPCPENPKIRNAAGQLVSKDFTDLYEAIKSLLEIDEAANSHCLGSVYG